MTQALAFAGPQARKAPPRRVSQRHDHDEREAQRAAEVVAGGGSVAGWSFSALPVSAARPSAVEHARTCNCGGTCPDCRRARLQRSSRSPAPAPQVDAGAVDAAVRTPGEPLRADTRSFFEERFGADLGDVRVHADAAAATSADALDAHAYAHGRHLVFGPGEYRPDSAAGRRLLAHELAHVLQQERTGERIQRDEKEQKKAPVDVVFVLDNDPESMRAAQALAPKVVRVYSTSDMKSELTKVGGPIGTLFVVSHSSSSGELKFESKIGTITWVNLNEIARDLKGVLPADKAPQVVDFRGCKLGEASEELGRFREAVGAKSVKAINCWSFDNVVGPVSIDNVAITSESQLTPENTATFEKGLAMLVNTLKSEDGTSVKNCILGLARGETAAKNMAKIRSQYFRAGGTITAEWASPEYNKTWQAGSTCYKDLTESTSPCKLTTKTAMAESGEESTRHAAAEGLESATEGVEATAEPAAEPEAAPV